MSQGIEKKYLLPQGDLPEFPVALEPPYVDSRIESQKSVFTIHGKIKYGFEKLCKKDNESSHELVKIRFHSSCAEELRESLHVMGISELSVFPSLEGLSIDIKREYGFE